MTAGIHRPFTPEELAAQRRERAEAYLHLVAAAYSQARRRAKAPITTEWHVERELRKAAMAYGEAIHEA